MPVLYTSSKRLADIIGETMPDKKPKPRSLPQHLVQILTNPKSSSSQIYQIYKGLQNGTIFSEGDSNPYTVEDIQDEELRKHMVEMGNNPMSPTEPYIQVRKSIEEDPPTMVTGGGTILPGSSNFKPKDPNKPRFSTGDKDGIEIIGEAIGGAATDAWNWIKGLLGGSDKEEDMYPYQVNLPEVIVRDKAPSTTPSSPKPKPSEILKKGTTPPKTTPPRKANNGKFEAIPPEFIVPAPSDTSSVTPVEPPKKEGDWLGKDKWPKTPPKKKKLKPWYKDDGTFGGWSETPSDEEFEEMERKRREAGKKPWHNLNPGQKVTR